MFVFKVIFNCKTYTAQKINGMSTDERLKKYDSPCPDERYERKDYTVYVDIDNPVGIGIIEVLERYYGKSEDAQYMIMSMEYICQPLALEATNREALEVKS